MTRAVFIVLVALLIAPLAARPGAQNRSRDPFLGGVPAGRASAAPIALTLADALRRGLDHNLGVLLEEQQVRAAEGARWRRMSGLLPDVAGVIRQSRQKVNLAAFGFTGFPGVPSSIVGPFSVFDARVAVTQPLLDVGALFSARSGAAAVRAERYGYEDARSMVTLVVTNLYLQSVSARSRVEAAGAEADTAESLYRLAADQNSVGLVPRIDVLRADVERKSAAQRRIVADNDAARARAALARAIGLPAGQPFSLSDAMSYTPLGPLDLPTLEAEAHARRPDVRRAEARVAAARATVGAARAERLPTLSLDADYGWIGSAAATAAGTFAVAANVRVPLFAAGRTQAKVVETGAELRQRQAEAEDLRAGVAYEIDTALRDLAAAADRVGVAETATALAAEALTQAEDRFRAGVATNIEIVQAQEAAASAREAYISSVYAHNLAKAALARTIGVADRDFVGFLEGQAPWQTPQ